jgi:hypothetical protein
VTNHNTESTSQESCSRTGTLQPIMPKRSCGSSLVSRDWKSCKPARLGSSALTTSSLLAQTLEGFQKVAMEMGRRTLGRRHCFFQASKFMSDAQGFRNRIGRHDGMES